jgi:hypothetical protein
MENRIEISGEKWSKIILHLCADIGSDSKPYKDNGYNVICIGKEIGVENYNPPQGVYGIIANPVCTDFSIARTGGKPKDPIKGMFLVNECLGIIRKCNPMFWVIENPATGALKDFLGKPNYSYHPWWFGSPWTKKTGLWGKFNVPKRIYNDWEDVPKIKKLYLRDGYTKPMMAQLHKSAKKFIPEFDCFQVEDDMSFRSLCSQKFAQAFYEANQ